MEKYKQAALSIAFLTIIFSGGLTAGFAGAENADDDKGGAQQEEMILNSFENDDYDSWRKIISTKSKIHDVVSRSDFEQFVTARKLARAGQYDKAIVVTRALEEKVKMNLDKALM